MQGEARVARFGYIENNPVTVRACKGQGKGSSGIESLSGGSEETNEINAYY